MSNKTPTKKLASKASVASFGSPAAKRNSRFGSLEEAKEFSDEVIMVDFDFPERNGGPMFWVQLIPDCETKDGAQMFDKIDLRLSTTIDLSDAHQIYGWNVLDGAAFLLRMPWVPNYFLLYHKKLLQKEKKKCNETKKKVAAACNAILKSEDEENDLTPRRWKHVLFVWPDNIVATTDMKSSDPPINDQKLRLNLRLRVIDEDGENDIDVKKKKKKGVSLKSLFKGMQLTAKGEPKYGDDTSDEEEVEEEEEDEESTSDDESTSSASSSDEEKKKKAKKKKAKKKKQADKKKKKKKKKKKDNASVSSVSLESEKGGELIASSEEEDVESNKSEVSKEDSVEADKPTNKELPKPLPPPPSLPLPPPPPPLPLPPAPLPPAPAPAPLPPPLPTEEIAIVLFQQDHPKKPLKRQKELTNIRSFDPTEWKTERENSRRKLGKIKKESVLRTKRMMDVFLNQAKQGKKQATGQVAAIDRSKPTAGQVAAIDTNFEVTNATIKRVDSQGAESTRNATGDGGDVDDFIGKLKNGLEKTWEDAQKELKELSG
ncbi:unknown protein [Seminavis robusta]|uniref:Uncharacterized protein n=1 Tax=Seminavis robusta TaxID=568900 RepID=A0A9N8DYA8_9STRA|nr:unknown protein [Seminavis robusta]|eukprot:Sro471_g149660.1 n/a (544) ;mRNA; f:15728-17631